MTSLKLKLIQKEVQKIKQVIQPDRDPEIIVFSYWTWYRELLHGKYGMRRINPVKHKAYPISEEEEVQLLREHYENDRPKWWKEDPSHPYSTFEKYLESHRCDCGRHG